MVYQVLVLTKGLRPSERKSHICVHVNLGCKIYVMVSKDNILHPSACYTVSVMGYGASENGGVFPDSEY